MGLDGWRSGIENLAGDILGLIGIIAVAVTLVFAIKAGIKGQWKETGKFIMAGTLVAILAFGGFGILKSLAGTAKDTVEQTQIGDVQISGGSNSSWDQLGK